MHDALIGHDGVEALFPCAGGHYCAAGYDVVAASILGDLRRMGLAPFRLPATKP